MLLTEEAVIRPHKHCWDRPRKVEQTMEVIADVEKYNDIAIVTLAERMDVFNAPLLMNQFNTLIDEGVKHFIIDLSAVRIVDADGDYPLLHLLKCAQARGGSVSLVCPPENPIRIFYEMMRLDILFDMVETLDEASAKFEFSLEN